MPSSEKSQRYPSAAVANYFLDKASGEGRSIDPLKLQKLLYCAHGWHLAVKGTPLLREAIEAWKWGPVVSSVYHEFKDFGRRPIDRAASDLRQDPDGNWRIFIPRLDQADLEASAEFLNDVWDVYRDWSGVQMSNVSHAPGTPWSDVRERKGSAIIDNEHIPDKEIREHFEEKLRKHRGEAA